MQANTFSLCGLLPMESRPNQLGTTSPVLRTLSQFLLLLLCVTPCPHIVSIGMSLEQGPASPPIPRPGSEVLTLWFPSLGAHYIFGEGEGELNWAGEGEQG